MLKTFLFAGALLVCCGVNSMAQDTQSSPSDAPATAIESVVQNPMPQEAMPSATVPMEMSAPMQSSAPMGGDCGCGGTVMGGSTYMGNNCGCGGTVMASSSYSSGGNCYVDPCCNNGGGRRFFNRGGRTPMRASLNLGGRLRGGRCCN